MQFSELLALFLREKFTKTLHILVLSSLLASFHIISQSLLFDPVNHTKLRYLQS